MFSSMRKCTTKLFREAQIRSFVRAGGSLLNQLEQGSSHTKEKRSCSVSAVAKIDRITKNGGSIKEMVTMWPDLVRDLMEDDHFVETLDAIKWTTEVLNYNLQSDHKVRALSFLYAYKGFAPADHLTEENLRLAKILTWCIELLETCSLMIDDLLDQAETRWDRSCWYKHNKIGLIAVNDALMLEQIPYELLRRYFRDKPYYLDLVESCQKVTLISIMGEALEAVTLNFGNKLNLDVFTIDRYNTITKYKIAYSFFFPIQLSLYFAGIKDPEVHNQAEKIMVQIGHFYQVKNDLLDCFGDQTAKVGKDIERGKCTWLAVAALQTVTPEQRKIFEEYYGKDDLENVAKIKQLYRDLELQEEYLKYRERSYDLVNSYIEQFSNRLSLDFFFKYRDQIYRRK